VSSDQSKLTDSLPLSEPVGRNISAFSSKPGEDGEEAKSSGPPAAMAGQHYQEADAVAEFHCQKPSRECI